MRKSPVLSPALQATPSTSTDSRYCSAGKAGVGVNSSMGVSATQKQKIICNITHWCLDSEKSTAKPIFMHILGWKRQVHKKRTCSIEADFLKNLMRINYNGNTFTE